MQIYIFLEKYKNVFFCKLFFHLKKQLSIFNPTDSRPESAGERARFPTRHSF